jgi:hypothetical protein
MAQQRPEEAEPLYAELVAAGREHMGGVNRRLTGLYMKGHGECLLALMRFAEAEPVLEEARLILSETLGADSIHTVGATRSLVAVCQVLGKTEKVARYSRLLPPPDEPGGDPADPAPETPEP